VLARFLAPRGRHRGGVQRGSVPVDAIGLGQLFESTWCSLRKYIIPLPHPIWAGEYSQRMPVFSTNRIHVSAARSDTRVVRPWAAAAPAGAASLPDAAGSGTGLSNPAPAPGAANETPLAHKRAARSVSTGGTFLTASSIRGLLAGRQERARDRCLAAL